MLVEITDQNQDLDLDYRSPLRLNKLFLLILKMLLFAPVCLFLLFKQ